MSSSGEDNGRPRDSGSSSHSSAGQTQQTRPAGEISSHRPSPSINNRQSNIEPALPRPHIHLRVPRSQVDLRRPVTRPPMADPAPDVIDLTTDDEDSDFAVRTRGPLRLPSLHAPQTGPRRLPVMRTEEVITVDLGGSETDRGPPRRRSSPEIEIVSARTVPRSERPTTVARDDNGQQARRGAGVARMGNLWNFLRGNPTDEALDTFTQERRRQNVQTDRQRREEFVNVIRDAAADRGRRRALPYGLHQEWVLHAGRIDPMDEDFELSDDIPMPAMMDFVATGFAIGPNARNASPPYIEPSPPTEGFIKSTEEDDIVICPNCSDELGVGLDTLKRQVWVAKACGHVRVLTINVSLFTNFVQAYCGECTKNRPVKRGPKGAKVPLKTKPFSKCVVEDCGKSVSVPKSMIPLYL
jgi:hypothetical protein